MWALVLPVPSEFRLPDGFVPFREIDPPGFEPNLSPATPPEKFPLHTVPPRQNVSKPSIQSSTPLPVSHLK